MWVRVHRTALSANRPASQPACRERIGGDALGKTGDAAPLVRAWRRIHDSTHTRSTVRADQRAVQAVVSDDPDWQQSRECFAVRCWHWLKTQNLGLKDGRKRLSWLLLGCFRRAGLLRALAIQRGLVHQPATHFQPRQLTGKGSRVQANGACQRALINRG